MSASISNRVRNVEFRRELNQPTFSYIEWLYVDGQSTNICLSSFYDGIDTVSEIIEVIKTEIDTNMLDIKHGLNKEDVKNILKIIEDKFT